MCAERQKRKLGVSSFSDGVLFTLFSPSSPNKDIDANMLLPAVTSALIITS